MHKVLFIVVPIIALGGFVFALATMFSPKLRGKLMGVQVKSMKYMVDENKDDLTHLSTTNANISKEGMKITAQAIKEGVAEDSVYCKHCGVSIDSDSKFCKNCGKEQ